MIRGLLKVDGATCMEDNNELVTVMLPLYRERLEHAEAAIRSIVNQTYRNLEVLLLLDDPENDRLCQLARDFERQDGRIKLIVNESNIGLTATLNRAIKAAHGQYLCRMDGDDISFANRIELQLGYLRKTGADLVGGFCEVIDDDGRFLYSVDNIPVNPQAVKRALRWNNCVPHPTWLGKASAFEGGYRSFPLCEDYDFLVRAELAGKTVANCPVVVLKYRMSKGSISRTGLFRQYLAQVYLTSNYGRGRLADIDKVDAYIAARYSESKDNGYCAANGQFNEGLKLMREHHLVAAASKVFACMLKSSGYRGKVFRLLAAAMTR